ncbi:MAG: geranylgeranylglycerol-phosphate geranylgeranyltransferase [Flavobacterium sp.]|nr:geranylgeranylglycerol-phosphate geranylgeranyltransferase [Candidatus Neoflavobacterium equi]
MIKRKTKHLLLKLLSLFSVVRGYNIFVIVIAQYLASIYIFAPEKRALAVLMDWRLFLIVFSSTLAIAGGYIINNFYDSEKDLINKPSKSFLDRLVSQGFKLKVYFALNFSAVLLSFVVSIHAALFFSAFIFLLWFYSHKLKKYPIIGNIVASFLAVFPFFGILMYFKNFYTAIFVHGILVVLLILIREMVKDLSTMAGDMAVQYHTLPVIYGTAISKRVIYLLSALTVVPIYLLTSVYDVGYMDVYLYAALMVLLLINLKLWKSDSIAAYSRLHLLLKILILVGVFSILMIDPNIIIHGARLFKL